ncbi:hypothetical protein O181_004868 [Austropuccinia psidii MF-1]|uniref:Uncharacterized protein n=1 Tax=Austropuccinia psidii MF-1 TaxID=1389203 RepID=A0A9Q3BH76_9BASI|nr:hypothetical protein [Austropuccinia psidii MF-1]
MNSLTPKLAPSSEPDHSYICHHRQNSSKRSERLHQLVYSSSRFRLRIKIILLKTASSNPLKAQQHMTWSHLGYWVEVSYYPKTFQVFLPDQQSIMVPLMIYLSWMLQPLRP